MWTNHVPLNAWMHEGFGSFVKYVITVVMYNFYVCELWAKQLRARNPGSCLDECIVKMVFLDSGTVVK